MDENEPEMTDIGKKRYLIIHQMSYVFFLIKLRRIIQHCMDIATNPSTRLPKTKHGQLWYKK